MSCTTETGERDLSAYYLEGWLPWNRRMRVREGTLLEGGRRLDSWRFILFRTPGGATQQTVRALRISLWKSYSKGVPRECDDELSRTCEEWTSCTWRVIRRQREKVESGETMWRAFRVEERRSCPLNFFAKTEHVFGHARFNHVIVQRRCTSTSARFREQLHRSNIVAISVRHAYRPGRCRL